MNRPESSSATGTVPSVAYGTDAFPRAAARFRSFADSDRGGRIAFVGGIREQRQAALATLTRHTTETVHQFRLPTLLSERRMQTQNAFRKAFDHAAEEGAMLYFDRLDDLFEHEHTDPLDDEGYSEPTAIEYFFERVEAYRGVVILGMQSDRTAQRIRQYDVDLIVRFDG